MNPQGIVAENNGTLGDEKARPNRREPIQLATCCLPALDAQCDDGAALGKAASERSGPRVATQVAADD